MWTDGGYSHMMSGYGFGGDAWWLPMGLHGIFSLLVIGLLIAGAIWVVRSFTEGRSTNAGLDELGKRYAAGDIGRDEYLEKKKDLEG